MAFPVVTLSEHIARSLFVAWRFLTGDAGEMKFLEVSGRGVLRSFTALAFAAPVFFIIQWLQFTAPGYGWINLLHYFALFGAYALAWAAFAFAVFHAHNLIGARPFFLRFITLYNWARIYVLLIMLPAFALSAAGVIEGGVKALVFAVSAAAALGYKYFITRMALAASVFHSVLFVLFDASLVMLFDALVFAAFGYPIDSPL